MTIIVPHKKRTLAVFLIALFVMIAISGGFYIFEYNRLVNLRFQLGELKQKLPKVQAANADFKNQFYTAIDPKKLDAFAVSQGLTLERHPEYLRLNPWVSVSTY